MIRWDRKNAVPRANDLVVVELHHLVSAGVSNSRQTRAPKNQKAHPKWDGLLISDSPICLTETQATAWDLRRFQRTRPRRAKTPTPASITAGGAGTVLGCRMIWSCTSSVVLAPLAGVTRATSWSPANRLLKDEVFPLRLLSMFCAVVE